MRKGSQKRPKSEAKLRPKSAERNENEPNSRPQDVERGNKRASKGTKTGPNEDNSVLKVRKVAKKVLPGPAETESYSRKTKAFTFDGLDAGRMPGAGGRSTRQIRGGPSWVPARWVQLALGTLLESAGCCPTKIDPVLHRKHHK